MGGRKSYPTRKYIGTSKEVKKEVKTLTEYFEAKEKPEIVSAQAIKTIALSKKPLDYSVYSMELVPVIYENLEEWTKYHDPNLLKRKISVKWKELKKDAKIKVPKEVDRLIVENAIKTLEEFK